MSMDTSPPDIKNSDEIRIKAEVEQVNFHSEDSGWTALKIRDVHSGNSLTAVGHLPETCQQGSYFLLFGHWANHKSFGPQFQFSRAVSTRPGSRDGISRYLSSGLFKGVGKATAGKIVRCFGLDTFDILDSSPERLKDVPGLSKKLAGKIAKEWQDHKQSHETHMFLSKHGITGATAKKLIGRYKSSLISKLSENPYFLIQEVRGIGFQKADQIGLSVGMSLRHPDRVRAGILFLLKQSEDQGHCFLSHEQLLKRLQTQLKIDDYPAAELDEQISQLCNRLKVVRIPAADSNGPSEDNNTWIFRLSTFEDESGIASHIKRLIEQSEPPEKEQTKIFLERVNRWIEVYCEKTGHQLSDQQKEAVVLAASSKVLILTGGPGVGKTTTANAMITLFRAMGRSLSLAAPTGRAAQRLAEISGQEAKTIHRLLEWSAQEGLFRRHAANPLNSQVIMIDEASMLDSKLGHHLLAAVPSSAQLILMGDADQLPSVGPGNVLRDLINSEQIPCLKLNKVFRQASGSRIIAAAHAINQGAPPQFSSTPDSDCHFIQMKDPAEILAKLRELLTIHLPQAGYHPLQDVQILTPMNKGELGSKNLNQHIQTWIHPGRSSRHNDSSKKNIPSKPEFQKNDKVIQCVNNYELGVFNGDIGFVTETRVGGAAVNVRIAGRTIPYSREQSGELSLAWAITIHKSQGSEFPVVIIPVSMSHYVMLQRNLIYTALTRAKKLAIFIGDPKALTLSVQNAESHGRQTWLIHELKRTSLLPSTIQEGRPGEPF